MLRTTNFEKITVGVLLIEMNKVGGCVSKVMRKRGFVRVGHVAIDDLFVNPKYMEDKDSGMGKQPREIQTWRFLSNPR